MGRTRRLVQQRTTWRDVEQVRPTVPDSSLKDHPSLTLNLPIVCTCVLEPRTVIDIYPSIHSLATKLLSEPICITSMAAPFPAPAPSQDICTHRKGVSPDIWWNGNGEAFYCLSTGEKLEPNNCETPRHKLFSIYKI